MNLQMKIHPAVVALVVVLGVVAIGMKIWADGAAKELGGPAQLLRDPSGHVYVQIQTQLLQHDAEGNFVHRHDLGVLGVDVVIGAMGFFSNGDLLLRRGPDQRSLVDNILAYRREENTRSLSPHEPDVGLARCNLETHECAPFAKESMDFLLSYGVFIDWETDDVIFSDTSRHLLRKYSSNGVEIADPVGGFKFPNQIMLYDGQLMVADTNQHRITIVDPSDAEFGKEFQSISVVPDAAIRRGDRWPSHFARIGDEWWVNIMKHNMRNGGVYAFDSGWNYKRRIPLADDADPIAIMPFGSGALISDWDNDRVRYIAISGNALPDLDSAGLKGVLKESRAERLHYNALSWMGIVFLAVGLIILVVRALVVPDNRVISK